MNKSGYSLIEIFGAIALVLTLVIIAVPNIRNFSEGGKQGAAARNASALNSAVAQYDQSGGLLTAKVPVLAGVENLPVNELPEMKVLNLLREADGGSLVSAWQEPVFSNEGYRVVWINEFQGGNTQATLSGERNADAEALVAAGSGGRFELIAPTDQPNRQGIVGFQQGGLLVASIEPETEASPTPVPANSNPAVTLTASNPSPKVGDLVAYYANGTDPDGDSLTYTFTHISGTEPAGSSSTFSRAYTSTGTFSVSVNVTDGKGGTAQASIPVTVGAAAADPSAGLTASPMDPHRGQVVTYTATGTDLNGEALTYRFIRDGSIVQEGASPTYSTSYSDLGPKLVTVVSINQSGLSKNADITVNVRNRAPSVSVGVNPVEGYRGQVITFTATGTDPDDDAMTYSFDGGAFAGSTFQKTYPTVGNYTVSVRSNDGMSQANSISASVTGTVAIVNRMPSVSLVVDKPTGVRGEEFTFTATGSDPDNDAIAYSFKVGPTGAWSEYKEANEFKHTFANVGEMEVFAKVRDSLGGESVESVPAKVTIVNRAPTVTWGQAPQEGYRNRDVLFTARAVDPDGDAVQYRFRQANGSWSAYGSGATFTTMFTSVGAHGAQVQVKDALGMESAVLPAGITIVLPPEYQLQARVVVQGGNANPAQVLTLSGISINGVMRAADETHEFSFRPAAGWVVDAVEGVPGYARPADARVAGGSATILLNDNKLVTFRIKPRPLVYYWNEVMPAGRGNAYPAQSIAESGMSFRAAAARGGHSAASLAGQLGVVNWANSSWRYAGGQSVLTGMARMKLPAAEIGYRVVLAQGHKYIWKWRTTKIHTSYAYSRSSNIVMLDGDSGELLAAASAASKPAIGATYGAMGVIAGTAAGSEAVNPNVRTTHNDSQTFAQGSPIAVDLNGNGQLDLLSGQDWRKSPDRAMVSSAFRKFKLDGETEKLWEWISNEDGLLVYNPEQQEVLEVTGKELFGNYTFGKKWLHGYEPLATLDKDGNGLLEGVELDVISVWKDENMDAQVQPGELSSASDLRIEYIATKPSFDRFANTMVEQGVMIGAETEGGPKTALATWDWISYGGLASETKLSDSDFFNSLSAYRLESDGLLKGSHLCFAPTENGYRVFWTIKPNDYTEQSTPFQMNGSELEWAGDVESEGGKMIPVKVSAQLGSDGSSISGQATFADGQTEAWTGSLITGLPVSSLNIAF